MSKTTRRYGAYGLCLMYVVFQPYLPRHSIAAESMLQNKRLFFTESQRSGMSEEPSSTIAAVVSHPRADPASIEVIPATNNKMIQRNEDITVRFTGVVAGSSSAVLLINDLPCKAIANYALAVKRTHVVILECPHIKRTLMQFSWLPVEQQLIVNSLGDEIARLYVGQSV